MKTLVKALSKLSEDYDWIKVKGKGKARDYETSLSNIKVNLNVDFNDSFLADPKPDGDDTIGSWPLSTEFPNSTANVVPGDRKEALPTSIPHEYEKENWENFFKC